MEGKTGRTIHHLDSLKTESSQGRETLTYITERENSLLLPISTSMLRLCQHEIC